MNQPRGPNQRWRIVLGSVRPYLFVESTRFVVGDMPFERRTLIYHSFSMFSLKFLYIHRWEGPAGTRPSGRPVCDHHGGARQRSCRLGGAAHTGTRPLALLANLYEQIAFGSGSPNRSPRAVEIRVESNTGGLKQLPVMRDHNFRFG